MNENPLLTIVAMFMAVYGPFYLLATHETSAYGLFSVLWKTVVYGIVLIVVYISATYAVHWRPYE